MSEKNQKNEVLLNFTSCCNSSIKVGGEKVKNNHQQWNRKGMPISMKMLCGAVVLLNVALLSLPTSAAKLPTSYEGSPGEYSQSTAPGNVGCLFSKTLCDEKDEWCYDDYAFGRCLATHGILRQSDLYRYELGKGDMHSLERQMERLFATGYRWGHSYTQCVLQNLLESLRRGVDLDESVCSDVQDQDLEGALKAFQEDIDPLNLAFIKYNPSAKNPHSDFADESYRPPKEVSYSSNGEIVTGKELLAKESQKISLQDRLKNPLFELSAPESNLLQESVVETPFAEEELANTVAKVKGPPKGKNKGKNKNKNKNKTVLVKKSILNEEYPGQSDNFNGVDIGPKKKDPAPPSAIGGIGQRGVIIQNLIDEKLGSDAETGLGPEGVVDERILEPKIFSSTYNTPDSFRHGGEQWVEGSSGREIEGANAYDLAELAGMSGGAGGGDGGLSAFDYEAGGSEDRGGIREELRLGQEEEEIREAVATLEAAALLNSLLQEDNGNIFRVPSASADPVSYSLPPQNDLRYPPYLQEDDQGVFYYPPSPQNLYPQQLQQQDEEGIYFDPAAASNDLQENLLYTDGGLVFLKKPSQELLQENSQNNEETKGLNFLKRYIDQPREPTFDGVEEQEEWGPVLDQQQVEALISPSGDDLRFGNSEFADNYGYDFDSPLFLLNRRNRNGFGFERRERLDVKKPGPWYRTVNNYAFDKDDSRNQKGRMYQPTNPEFAAEGPADMDVPSNQDAEQNDGPQRDDSGKWQKAEKVGQLEKKSAPVKFEKSFPVSMSQFDDGRLDIIDTSYANVVVDKSVKIDWKAAKNLVHAIADSLDIDSDNFKEITLTDDVVTFKVETNDKGLNASEVARRIPNVAENVERDTGIKILRSDVGMRANSKTPSVLALYENQDPASNQIYIATFAVCGLVAAVLVAAVAIFLIRKHSKSREKLVRLSQNDPSFEACKDYQDLCRARMAGSKNNEKMEPLRGPAHKIASKESETSSSRSSTSSWNEEPVLTNMDISTGHMVLSYMEDHLKNRDRMDQEWGSLCAYEADPCSIAVAEKTENNKKNRYSNSVPFDHSRVILNDLANVSGSDYINASTITDHDPRNPAYIATQGPLPNTAADFWQMVWEQGSVVIVNLTRLTESTTALCHRYWPEEGSELHHIYEVHLVSEHIWCDEYLVRSFYLKNLKTGETRTVTQFHFLAWPENGIPQSTKALLEFRRKVNKSYRGRSCPIIVHCSDGAGRTGTYCLIDMVLNRMTKGAKEIDIAASLEHIRDQRPGMVRTKQQFEFVLMAVAEEVHAILKALPQ